MRKLILSLVAASATVAAVPASAQIWQIQPRVQNQIQVAAQRRTISQREAVSLRRQAVDIRQLLAQYNRNGLNRQEVTALESRINRVRQNLRLERRDWDGRRG